MKINTVTAMPIILLLLFLLSSLTAFGETVFIKEETVLHGTILQMDNEKIIIESDVGIIEVPRYKIEKLEYEGIKKDLADDVGQKEIIEQGGSGEAGMTAEDISTADQKRTREDRRVKLNIMLLNKQFLETEGMYRMQVLASSIPLSDRLTMYAAHKRKDQGIATGLNLFIPSLGSWVQGDIGGALAQDFMIGLGIGLILLHEDDTGSEFMNLPDDYEDSDALFYTGVGILAFEYLFGLIRPSNYVKNWRGYKDLRYYGAKNIGVSLKLVNIKY
jgi:hypothetical protein